MVKNAVGANVMKILLKFCVRNRLSIEMVLFLWMVSTKDFKYPKSIGNKYICIKKFSVEHVINPLVNLGYVLNLNNGGNHFPEFFVLTDTGQSLILELEVIENERSLT